MRYCQQTPHLVEGDELYLVRGQSLVGERSLECVQVVGSYGNQTSFPGHMIEGDNHRGNKTRERESYLPIL